MHSLSYFRSLLVWCAALSAGPLVAVEPQAKTPVPNDAAMAAAAKVVGDIYKKDLDAAKSPESKAKLAAKLLQDGIDTRDDPAARFVLYRAGRKLSAGAGDVDLALRIVDQWQTDFAVDGPALVKDLLTELAPLAKTPEDNYIILRTARRLSRAAAAADQYESSMSLIKLALDAAKKIKDPDIIKQCEAEARRLPKAAEQFEPARAALSVLEAAPADPAANTTAGKYFCFVKGNWEKGLPMLALGSDAALKDLAARDLRLPADAPTQFALADAWYDFAKTLDPALQPRLLSRSGYWYRLSPLGASGLPKLKIDKRLIEIDAVTSPFHAGEWVELLDYVDVSRDRLRGLLEWRNSALSADSGAEVMMPVTIDGSYELRLRAASSAKSDVATISFPFPGHEAILAINGSGNFCSIWKVNNMVGDDPKNPARNPGIPYSPGRPFNLEMRVEKKGENAAIAITFDGRKCLQWEGPITALGRQEGWDTERCGQKFLLGVKAPVRFHSVRFKLISGTAWLVE